MTIQQFSVCGALISLTFHLISFSAVAIGGRGTAHWGFLSNLLWAIAGLVIGGLLGFLWNL